MEWKEKENMPTRRNNKVKKGRNVVLLDLPLISAPPKSDLHPCVYQFGSCLYGSECYLATFPGTACIYHLQQQFGRGAGCSFGRSCVGEHVDIREFAKLTEESQTEKPPAAPTNGSKPILPPKQEIPISQPPVQQKKIEIQPSIPQFPPQSSPHQPPIPQSPRLIPESPPFDPALISSIELLDEIKKLQQLFTTKVFHEEIQVLIPPSNRDNFPWELDYLEVQVVDLANYPETMPKFYIMNKFDQVLSQSISKRIREHALSMSGGSQLILHICKWIQSNLYYLMINEEITQSFLAKKREEEILALTDFDTDEPIVSQRKVEQVSEPVGSSDTLDLRCESVHMENIGVLECYQLNLTVACFRCKRHIDVSVIGRIKYTSVCPKCNFPFGMSWSPDMIHASSNRLGSLEKINVTIHDFLPSCFKLDCLDCNYEQTQKKIGFSGEITKKNCFGCHKEFSVSLSQLQSKEQKTPCSLDVTKIAAQKTKPNKNTHQHDGIFSGHPLPNNGACRHFKKSKRWMRFPCCRRVFPCHLCHDQDEDHQAERAHRIICGFCSAEQPFHDEPCLKCATVLVVTSQSNNHWQGGQGCRSLTELDKKDSKKYRGQNKTISKKAMKDK